MPHQQILLDQSFRVLEWDTLMDFLAQEAHSSLGAEQCRARELAETLEQANNLLEETSEMRALLAQPQPFPVLNFPDLRPLLRKIQKSAECDALELRDLSSTLGLFREVRCCLHAKRNCAPRLWRYVEDVDQVSYLKSEIDQCIDPEGHMLDSASATLHDAVQEAKDCRTRLRHRVECMLTSERYQDVLQEHYFAIREGRYVLPVKVDMQGKIAGIVHDVSASGATVFLEPRELIELNNQLRITELRIQREVQRILHELSMLVTQCGQQIAQITATLGALDAVSARARLSEKMRGQVVRLNIQGSIELREARHPLLALTKQTVVANDVVMGPAQRVLIVSGPNTGGKTVMLKLLGLFALMVRRGLHPPCAPDSHMAFFPYVFADIGDAQDLSKDLSSFSAHILMIIRLLETVTTTATSSFSNALVLLDEITGSTDPNEGAALGAAVLHRLAALGLKVVVTTHYEDLKILALTCPGFANASLEFDVQTLKPTYRFLQGFPGGSSALAIAKRLGMDAAILDEANKLVRHGEHDLDAVFQDLQSTRRRMDEEIARVTQERQAAAKAAKEAQELRDRLQASEREEKQKIKLRLNEEFRKARSAISEMLETLKQQPSVARGKAARGQLSELSRAVLRDKGAEGTIALDQLGVGDWVEVKHLGTRGTLLESPKDKKRVRVRVGDAEILVGVAALIGVRFAGQDSSGFKAKPNPQRVTQQSPKAVTSDIARLTATINLDLRGYAIEDALELLPRSLDRAILQHASLVRLIHGHGTGKLKSAVRKFLTHSPYVHRFYPGTPESGGDGVTIVELK